MNRSAGLVFGGLAVRDADLAGQAAVPGGLVQVPFDGLLGAPPQLARLAVPDHVGGVVVAVRAQRLAELGIVAAVAGEAGVMTAVRAPAGVTAGVTGLGPALTAGPVSAGVLADRAGVNRPQSTKYMAEFHLWP